MNEQKIKKMMSDVETKIKSSEYRAVTLKGVKNLSRSDLDTLLMYGDALLKGTTRQLIEPRGSILNVLLKYGIEI